MMFKVLTLLLALTFCSGIANGKCTKEEHIKPDSKGNTKYVCNRKSKAFYIEQKVKKITDYYNDLAASKKGVIQDGVYCAVCGCASSEHDNEDPVKPK
jgi:hypothetical protein